MYSSKIYFTVPNLVEIYSWKFKLSYNKCNPFPTTNVVHFSLPPQFITKVTWRRLTLKREIFSYRISYISNILALKTFDGWSKPFHILCVWQRAGITINKSGLNQLGLNECNPGEHSTLPQDPWSGQLLKNVINTCTCMSCWSKLFNLKTKYCCR